jgi:hypothetical protein
MSRGSARGGGITRIAAVVMMALVLTGGVGRAQASSAWTASPAVASAATWRVIASPNTNGYKNYLNHVARVPGTTQFWAVGNTQDGLGGGTRHSLIERTLGSSWTLVSSPDPVGDSELHGVTATSTNDAWAVGAVQGEGGGGQMLIDHWNGTRWSVVSAPAPTGAIHSQLLGVRAFSASDALAVGSYSTATGGVRLLVEHWDGTSWSVEHAPKPTGCYPSLNGVAAVPGTTQRFAVGTCIDTTTFASTPLIEYWNGTGWSIAQTPAITGALLDVTPVSGAAVWAVGYTTSGTTSHTLTERWNGSQWSVITSPNVSSNQNNWLSGVIRVPGTQTLWAVGANQPSGTDAFAMRWSGSAWSIIQPVQPGQTGGLEFDSVAASSATNVWAVGSYTPTNATPVGATLVERYG